MDFLYEYKLYDNDKITPSGMLLIFILVVIAIIIGRSMTGNSSGYGQYPRYQAPQQQMYAQPSQQYTPTF